MFRAVQQYLTETTVHGLLHFTGERKLYIKAIWLTAVVISFSFCTHRVSDVCRRYARQEVATTVQANALEFEFPDVYICYENPISGSHSVTLGAEDSALLSQYRRIVNRTMSTILPDDRKMALDSYGIRLINTLPYQFLSDKMGHRFSSVLSFFLEGNSDWTGAIHRHPFFLNCFNLNLTDKDRVTLQNPSNNIQVLLFMDPPLPPPFDNSTESDIRPYESGTIDLKPVDLDANYGIDFTIPTGIRVFLTPRGQYPSDFEKQIVIGPGQQHRVVIQMQDIVYNEVDFAGKCQGSGETSVDFLNPYSGQKERFNYSHAVCFYREVARLSQEQFNCSVWRQPIPWEYRSLPSCYNISQFLSDIVFNDTMASKRAQILNLGRMSCENKIPCRSRTYTYEYSSSSWPSDREWEQFLVSYIRRKYIEEPADDSQVPGIKYLVYNSSTEKARRSIIQLSLSAASRMSSETQLALSYSFNSLIADVGGLLGLFLGMSLLSVLELLELLHGCIAAAAERRRARIDKHRASDNVACKTAVAPDGIDIVKMGSIEEATGNEKI